MLNYVRDNNNYYQNDQPNKLNNNPNKSIIGYKYNHHKITNYNQLTNQSNIFNIFNQNECRNKYKPFRITLQDIELKQINLF